MRGRMILTLLLLLPQSLGAQSPPPDLKRLSIEQLLDIDVTSLSRKSATLSTTAAAVEVITGEDIRRSGATSLPEALRLFTGLQVSRFNTGTWSVSVRGFNTNVSNKLLVLIDGRSVYSPLFSGVFWDVQDVVLASIERIEVVRGPGASLWGANAVNGIISIITKTAEKTQGWYFQPVGGGHETLGGLSATYGGKAGKDAFYRIDAKYNYHDQLRFANGKDTKDPLRVGRAGFRFDTPSSNRDSFTVQGDAYLERTGLSDRADVQADGGNLLSRWTRTLGAESDLQLQVYYDRTFRLVPLQSEERRDTVDVDLQHRFQRKYQDIVWGAEYRISSGRTSSTSVLSFSPQNRTSPLYTAFVQDEFHIVPDKLSIIAGSKFEHNDYTGFEYQPGVRAVWVPKPQVSLWTSVSRALRTPARFDSDIQFRVPGLLFQGSPDFKSETLIAYEAGGRAPLSPRLSLDVAAFYNVYDDIRSQALQIPPGNLILVRNDLNATAYGGEVMGILDLKEKWRVHAGYSLLRNKITADPGTRDLLNGTTEGNDARHQFEVRSSVDLPHDFELDTTAHFTGQLPAPVVPRYLQLDARLGWFARPNIEIAIVGRNLTEPAHPEFGTPGPNQVEVRRDIYATLAWRF